MKPILITSITLIFLLFMPQRSDAACENQSIVKVNGLVCDFCARAIEKVFRDRAEVADVKVDLDSGRIVLDYRSGQAIQEEEVKTLLTNAGYDYAGMQPGCKS